MNARRSINLRQATPADAGDLCTIYNREVEQSTVTLDLVPRSLDEQRAYIADRSGGLVIVVAEIGDVVVGFASLSFYRDRSGYRTSVEDSVYVDRDHQGLGVGSALLGELLLRATNHGFHTVFARVIGPQEASVALHERHGFSLVGVEREVGRKFGRWHDVALLQKLL
jgi:phosphinothricin acetyltransferase